ncbi:DUF397 domain-containing protein [Nocardia sp. SYP-A9097]|uniref:DUF397 domain-containing protein n=1 Tax=Nocardia sp. SYP-A9097 TaxID=2663237 RepID=UPI001327255C|nr:DUF397 domain-containing protein [Nocardia sp. SYP-A9097]MRH89306.1 DUF397 domain-containing protein [Nocardia sp. SYP-A9097]
MKNPVKGEWYKSSRSGKQSDCVEVFHSEDMTKVRDTKDNGRGPVLEFPADTWTKFVDSRVWES